jgi:hypothetical protein
MSSITPDYQARGGLQQDESVLDLQALASLERRHGDGCKSIGALC